MDNVNDNQVFDLVEGGEKIDLFTDNTVKPISKMNLGELAEAAEILTNYGGLPSGKDIPEELQGEDRRQWYMNNAVNPLTGETLSDYMKDNGLDFRTGRNAFRKEVMAIGENVKEQIRVKGGTKIDLFKLAIDNEKIGNFLGVTEEMKANRDHFWIDNQAPGMDRQTPMAQKTMLNVTKRDALDPLLNKYMSQLGYSTYMQLNQQQPDKFPWEAGQMWNDNK